MVRTLRVVGQLATLLGTIFVTFGLQIGEVQPVSTPSIKFHGGAGLSFLGQSPAVVRVNIPWMPSVGLWLVMGGVLLALAAELLEWRDQQDA